MSTLSQFFGGSTALAANQREIELLVVGGGSSPTFNTRNGGGAGQLVFYKQHVITAGTSYTVTVGGGGSLSSFGSITAFAGNQGGSSDARATCTPSIVENNFMSLANGISQGEASGTLSGFGGGGAGTPGFFPISSSSGGNGGFGALINITGSQVAYAGGGGGGVFTGNAGIGGIGGGGNGSASSSFDGNAGSANTGGGGGGDGGAALTGNGGSGIVIIAYPNTFAVPATITGTHTTPTRSGFRVYRFTGSGSITF